MKSIIQNIPFENFRYSRLFYGYAFLVLLVALSLLPSGANSQNSLAYAKPHFIYELSSDTSYASDDDDRDTSVRKDEAGPEFDEVLVTMNVVRIGSFEIQAIIYNELAYLPVHELFSFLKIKSIPSNNMDSVSGFFINPKAPYIIDKSRNRITYQDKIFRLKSTDLIRTETDLYLKTDHLGKIFGLECAFNFRSLSISLNTKAELPAIREMQQEAMRKNMEKFKGERKADTTIGRKFSLFHLGMADWSVMTTQELKGTSRTRASLDIGAILAGGEMNAYLNYNSNQPFSMDQQYFRWRHVNNNSPVLRQVVAGRIAPQSIASIYRPVTGVQFTNTPTINRKSFGTYTLSNKTEPGWTVELYMNDVLIDYTKSDASGFYTFEVPMVYGNTLVKLRFFGPWGEERTEQQYLSIPFNFVPLYQLEYTVSAGMVDDEQNSRFSRASFNYGLGRRISIGGGNEYLSSITYGKNIPFLNASVRVGSNLFLTGEHSYGVRTKMMLNYKLPSNLRIDLDYTKYEKGQQAIRLNYLDEKKAVLSMPLRGKKWNAFTRLTVNQFTVPNNNPISLKRTSKYTNSEFLLSSSFKGIGANLTTNAVFIEAQQTYVYSNLALTVRLPKGLLLRPQAQYDFRNKNLSMAKAEVEKYLSYKGFANVFYEKSFLFKTTSIGIGFRYNLSFAQTSFSARKSNNVVSLTQSANGSILYNEKTKRVGVSAIAHTGRGALVIIPYLDLNCNGKRDAGEPKAVGLKLSINGGRIVKNEKDTTISIMGLEAYNSYYLELDKNSFENIAWQMRKSVIKVTVEPNHFKSIEVPVAVVGEVSGSVLLNDEKGLKGLGRILVNIYDSNSVLVAKTLTESDGFFSYIGLAPGSYTARIDAAQLLNIKMIPSSPGLSFTIKQGRDGDVVDGLEFALHKL